MERKIKIELSYHEKQQKIFFKSKARYKIIAKGRRFGLTKGFANYVIENMIKKVSPVLWIDTIYGNIERYVERYFIPELQNLPNGFWNYRKNRNELKILDSVCDFRSADKPENIEGFGYALIIINEAGIVLKNKNLWNESIRPMVLDYKADVLIGGTPKGKRNKRTGETHLFYELSQKAQSKNKDWEFFNFSSYDNPILDPKEIKELEDDISVVLRDQEIYGLFVDNKTHSIIKSEWWNYYKGKEYQFEKIIGIYQSWDTAFKTKEENDYSVCTTWIITKNKYYLIDMFRERLEFPDLKRKAIEIYEKYNPHEIWIEDKASGQSLIQELNRETRLPIKPIKITKDKIERVNAITPLIESGKIYLPENKEWLQTFIRETEDFPDGEFDDIVDSVSQFLITAKEKIKSNNIKKSTIHVERKSIGKKYQYYNRRN